MSSLGRATFVVLALSAIVAAPASAGTFRHSPERHPPRIGVQTDRVWYAALLLETNRVTVEAGSTPGSVSVRDEGALLLVPDLLSLQDLQYTLETCTSSAGAFECRQGPGGPIIGVGVGLEDGNDHATVVGAPVPTAPGSPYAAQAYVGLVGGPGADVLEGGDGNDYIRGDTEADGNQGGADVLVGGDGDDDIEGGTGSDDIQGGPGDDRLGTSERVFIGSTLIPGERDDIQAGPGDDRVSSRDEVAEVVDCGPGSDTVRADPSDTLVECEEVSVS